MKPAPVDTYQLILASGHPTPAAPEAGPNLQGAYALWKEVVRETYKTLGKGRRLPSDQFTRQDLIAGVFDEARCAGLVCFRRTNTSCAIDRADSWFQSWPDELLAALGKEHPCGLIMSFLMVHPDYRRRSLPAAEGLGTVSDVIVKVASLVFLESGAQLGYGITRNNRGVNRLAQSAGWKPVVQNVRHVGYDADLIVLTRPAAREACAAFDQTTLKLWAGRIQRANPRLYEADHADAN